MDEIQLKIEKLKASLKRHECYLIWWQTKILSGENTSTKAHDAMNNHMDLIRECVDNILAVHN